jgi:hypothetical protein
MIMIRRARATAPVAVADVPEDVSLPVPDDTARTVAPAVTGAAPIPPVPDARGAVARRRPVNAHARAERRYAADLADGQVPSLRALMRDLGLGQPKAREVRAHLASLATADGEAS